MKIAFDIDGVIADTTLSVQKRVIEKFGIEPEDLRPGDYTNIYTLDDKEKQDEINTYIRKLFVEEAEVYAEAEEIPGAWVGSHLLKPVAYITRRPDQFGIAEATRIWLMFNGFYQAPVYFIPKGTCKSSKAKELGVDVLIEDSPHEIISCRENGLTTLVMAYPYNESARDENTVVVHNWGDILKWAGVSDKEPVLKSREDIDRWLESL